MSSITDRREHLVPSADGEQGEERFLHRWSRRKQQALQPGVPEAVAPATPEPAAPVLTDADMPPVESLGADSDYSPFMSSGVSDELRNKALRKLFTLPSINQRDPLDGEYYDCRGYLPLGDVITHEMRDEMEREAQKQKQKDAAVAEDVSKSSVRGELVEPPQTASVQSNAGPSTSSGRTVLPQSRHSKHLRKRSKSKRSRA